MDESDWAEAASYWGFFSVDSQRDAIRLAYPTLTPAVTNNVLSELCRRRFMHQLHVRKPGGMYDILDEVVGQARALWFMHCDCV
jgi:hypothetical protein